jgi:carbonic anhydrase/acetyltransferase-like protein (isoleucine patch superfamily)
VHYGVTMGDRVVLDADSFLMKGETPEAYTAWRGNPAKLARQLTAEGDAIATDAEDTAAYRIAAE